MLFFVKNSLGKGSVGWYVVMMQQPVFLEPKFGVTSLHMHILMQLP
jgi:hypothetical protein